MADTGSDIQRAAELLKAGKLVAIPTETVYGLAANALDEDACLKIFSAKNRPTFDPLIVHVSSIEEVSKYASEFPDAARKLCEKMWPGPMTVVLPKKQIIPDLVTSGQQTVGLRIPSHPLTLELLKLLPFPLAAPSANPFGYVSPTTAKHVNDQLGNRLDYILDGGACSVGVESTIIKFGDALPVVLRLGGMAVEDIEKIIGPVDERISQNSNPDAPGQLDQHYSPKTRFILSEGFDDNTITTSTHTGYLRFRDYLPGVSTTNQWLLSENGDLATAAKNLFKMMREMDDKSFDLIIAEPVPESGLGRAINDRLKRAAFKGISPE